MSKSVQIVAYDRTSRGSIIFDESPDHLEAWRTGGGFTLVLPVSVTLKLSAPNEPCPLVSNLEAELSFQNEQGNLYKIGHARTGQFFLAAVPELSTLGQLAWTDSLAALARYEALREGRSPRLKIRLHGELCLLYPQGHHRLRGEPQEISGEVEIAYPPDKWTRMLRTLGVADVISLEIPLQSDPPTGWEPVWGALRDARASFDQGGSVGWNNCVVAIRRALEAWQDIEQVQMGPGWKAPSKEERHAWTKRQRLDGLRWHLLQCAHLAPHSNAQEWTRSDALLLLSGVSGLLALRRP